MARVGVREWLALAPVMLSGKLDRYSDDTGGPLKRFETDFCEKFGDPPRVMLMRPSSSTSATAATAMGRTNVLRNEAMFST